MMLGAAQPDKDAPPPGLADYFAALHKRDRSIIAWEKFLSPWDALLCPVSMTTAFSHCEAGTPLKVDGRDEDYWMVAGHGALFNYSGHPAIAMPYGLDGDGLPIGVQLVGRRWSESRLLAVAQAMSPLTGGFGVRPAIEQNATGGTAPAAGRLRPHTCTATHNWRKRRKQDRIPRRCR